MRIKEYHTFGELWQQRLHPYRASLPYNCFPFIAKQKDGFFELDEKIHLPNWPEQAKTEDAKRPNREIDIVVHARERFSLAKPHLIEESKISVSYFRIDSNFSPPTAIPFSTIRFDYDRQLRLSHPLFHFHFCPKPVEAPDPAVLESWHFEISSMPNASCYPFRVPTPHMGLCSVLLGLVAEHLDVEKFRDLWDVICKNGWQPPALSKTNLWERCNPDTEAEKPFHSWQWYFWD